MRASVYCTNQFSLFPQMHMGVFAPHSYQLLMKGSCPASTGCQNTSNAQANEE